MVVGFLGGGYSDDVLESSLSEKFGNPVDSVLSCGAGSEAENHTGVNKLDGLVGGSLLVIVLRENGRGEGDGRRKKKSGGHGGVVGPHEIGEIRNGHCCREMRGMESKWKDGYHGGESKLKEGLD